MKKFSIVVGLLIGLGACSNKIDKALSELEGWKDKMCACKDKDCAEKVEKDFDAWNKEMKAKFKDDKDGTEDQKKRAKELFHKLHDCESKAEGDTPPGAAVDTPPAAPPAENK